MTNVCGIGDWDGPKPGDPDNNVALSASSVIGGVRVTWTYPSVNPHAVAHTLLFRGSSPNFSNSTQVAVVSGNVHFDQFAVLNETYLYYWIKIVSVNGTTGALIGPAGVYARNVGVMTAEALSQQISEGALATALNTKIGVITQTKTDLDKEIANRFSEDAALAAKMAAFDAGQTAAVAGVLSQTITLVDGVKAFAAKLDTVAALNKTNSAAIFNEEYARVTADNAIAYDISRVFAASASGNAAGVVNSDSARLGYSVISGTTQPYAGDNSTIIYPVAKYPKAQYPYYDINRKLIIDSLGVDLWNAQSAFKLQWVAGLPIAQAVKQVGISGPWGANGAIASASIESLFSAQAGINGQIATLYTVKMNIMQDGTTYIGGFGLAGDMVNGKPEFQAGFDVDTFWMGRPIKTGQTSKVDPVYPFMLSGGKVYIKEAIIQDASIGTAHIKDLSVDTIKVKDNAITVPLFGSSAAANVVTNAVYLTAGASLMVMGNASVYSSVDGWYNATITVGLVNQYNQVIYATGGGGGYTRVDVFGNVSAFGIFTALAAGWYAAGAIVSIQGGTAGADKVSIAFNTVVAMGAKK